MLRKLIKHQTGGPALAFIALVVLAGIFAAMLSPNDPYATNLANKFANISWQFPLGTDQLGRCIFSRLVYGIRTTLFYAFIIMCGTMLIGTVLGIVAGYFSQIVDEIIMRVVDVLLSFPSQVMIFAFVALLGIDIWNVVIANIAIKWAWYARVIRGIVLRYRTQNFILFSQAIGSSPSYILKKHILPNIAAELAVLASIDIGWAILNISTLSFLGLGVQPPIPEWGAMLNESKQVIQINPLQIFIPGLAIMLLVSAFNLLGDAISELFNPKEITYE